MLDRDAASGRSGGLTTRVSLVLVAMILGALLPVGVSAFAATRDPLPPSCHAGAPTAVANPGGILFADQSTLSLVESDLGQPRKLVDYSPATARSGASPAASSPAAPAVSAPASAPASPAASPAPAASGSPGSGSPTPATSPTPEAAPARFIAAAISADHRLAAFLVTDPPGGTGLVSLRLLDLSQPSAAAVEVWNGPRVTAGGRGEVSLLPNGAVLFRVPQRFDPPEKSTGLVGVVLTGPPAKVVQLSPEEQFTASLHASWPETKDYALPDDRPRVSDRVLGPNNRVAGRVDRRVKSPITDRTVHQIVTGKLGQEATTVLCGVVGDLTTAAFSPDGKAIAVTDGTNSQVLDAGGGRATVFLLRGRVLDWRA